MLCLNLKWIYELKRKSKAQVRLLSILSALVTFVAFSLQQHKATVAQVEALDRVVQEYRRWKIHTLFCIIPFHADPGRRMWE